MSKCKCGSYAINKHRQHFTSSLTRCDPCHWRDRAEYVELQLVEMLTTIASLEGTDSSSFKRLIVSRADLIAKRVEDYHMKEQSHQLV